MILQRHEYDINNFIVSHPKTIPATFTERIKFFWESGLTCEEITDRIYLTSRYQTDGLGRGYEENDRRPVKTDLYFQCLNEVRKEMKRLEDAEKQSKTRN